MLDNYSTHKTAEVNTWLDTPPRFKMHFTPTSASWLNLVERFFAEITGRRIRRGTFTRVNALETAIQDYLDHYNGAPKPFVWTKKADAILEKEARAAPNSTPSNPGTKRQTRNTSSQLTEFPLRSTPIPRAVSNWDCTPSKQGRVARWFC